MGPDGDRLTAMAARRITVFLVMILATDIPHNRVRLVFTTHVGDLRRIYGVWLARVAVLLVFVQKPLSFAGDILDKLRNRWRGSKPVDKAFSGFSMAFFLEKLDENKFCGNHRST